METLKTTHAIRTFSGKYVNVFEPDPSTIVIDDIANALSKQCRWGGHLDEIYSVGQHSIMCAERVPALFKLSALLHDASEAYLIDIPRPIKQNLLQYKEIEDKLMKVIAKKFRFQYPLPDEVKAIDDYMLQVEWHELMLCNDSEQALIQPMPHKAVRSKFLSMYTKFSGSVPAEFLK